RTGTSSMTRQRPILILLAAVLVGVISGFVAGYWSATRYAEQPTPPEHSSESPGRRFGAPRAAALAPTAGEQAPPELSKPSGSKPTLAAVLASIPVADYGPRDGQITGRVLTIAGEPVAGALITAEPRGEPDIAGASSAKQDDAGTFAVLEAARASLAWYRWHHALASRTTTGPDGTYALSGLAAAPYRLRAEARGYTIRTATGTAGDASPGPDSVYDFTAKLMVELSVDVVLPSGEQPEKATVHYRSLRGGTMFFWCPRHPKVRLEPRSYFLYAKADGGYRSPPVAVTLRHGEEPETLRLVLAGSNGIRGDVIRPADDVGMVTVKWARVDRNAAPQAGLLDENGWVADSAFGHYKIKDLDAGTYLVGAGRTRQRMLVAKVVEVAKGVVEANLELPPLTRAEVLVLRVFDPQGNPMSDVRVDTSTGGTRRFTTAEDGSLWVLTTRAFWEAMAGRRKVPCTVEVDSKDYGSALAAVPRREAPEVTVRFGSPATLAVTVDGYVGSGHEGRVWVILERPDGHGGATPIGWFGARPDASGHVVLGPLVTEPCELVLLVGEKDCNSLTAARLPLELLAGRNETVVTLPPLFRLSLLLPESSPRTFLSLRKADGDRHNAWGNRQSDRIVFESVPAGDYLVHPAKSEEPLLRITIAADREVRLDLNAADADRDSAGTEGNTH
ncbi:carboxypeptidase-like regulatory domain-containing protein, partial [Planctomycetota bacterium]